MSRVSITARPLGSSLLVAVFIAGCASPPMGPTARVLPAPGKPFEVFAGDQALCKDFAGNEVSGGATLSNLKQIGTAVMGTALGAGFGAAMDSRHNTMRGVELGGAVGTLAGGAAAAHGSAVDQNGLQSRYDLAYTQCMYSRGNQVAGAGRAGTPGGYGIAARAPLPADAGGPGPGAPPGAYYPAAQH